jgi:hypothetical protein
MPVILATQQAEIRRITVQSQSRQIVYETPISKTTTTTTKQTLHKKGLVECPQVSVLSSSPSTAKKKKKERQKVHAGRNGEGDSGVLLHLYRYFNYHAAL